MAGDVAITRSVLSDQVKGRLLAAILEGRYPPGARIVETRVAREFGTSQAPVREALRDLEALGVVETAPFRGARVRRPSINELLDAFEVRLLLETYAARLALARAGAHDVEALDEHVAAMRDAARSGDRYAEASADTAFHHRIVELSGNSTLERVWGALEPFLRTYLTIVSAEPDPTAVAGRHEPIVEAFRSGDASAVESAFRLHFDAAAAGLIDAWPTIDAAQAVAHRPSRDEVDGIAS